MAGICVTVVFRQILTLAITLLFVGACTTLEPQNVSGTLQAEMTAFDIESDLLENRIAVEGTALIVTIEAAQTDVFELVNKNSGIVPTVRAIIPPTLSVQTNSFDDESQNNTDAMMMEEGETTFRSLATSEFVRDSDGCVENAATSFSTGSPRIYLTTEAVNLAAGSELQVRWSYQGQEVTSSSWTSSSFEDVICLWFYITPSDVPFSVGEWSATLYMNDRAVQAPVSFMIEEN